MSTHEQPRDVQPAADAPDRETRPPAGPWQSEPGSGLFVWATWAAMTVVALILVLRFGPRIPIWDDYDVIPVLVGQQPMTLEWLWSQHNEHRIFLPRLALLAVFRWTGHDFRAGMVLNVVLLAALAALVPTALASARRGWRYSDALYPLLFLNLGHGVNLIWNMSLSYILPVTLGGLVLALIAARPGLPGLGRGLLVALALALLPLCNAAGVAFAPIPALWLIGVAVAHARSGRPGAWTRAATLGVAALPALALTALYFHDLERSSQVPPPPDAWSVARTTLQFLGTGLGSGGMELGLAGGLVVAGLMAAALASLMGATWTRPGDRSRALGLLAVWGAVATLALGTGWGRAGMGEMAGAQERYAVLATPALLIGAVAFEVFGPGSTRRLVPMVVFSLLCVVLWPNTQSGLATGRSAAARSEAFLSDLHFGMPRFLLVRRHTPFVLPTQDDLAANLAMLQAAGIEPFGRIAPDPPLREQPIDPTPSQLQLARWDGRAIEALGVDPQVVIELPRPTRIVAGVRIAYSHANAEGSPARFKLAWRRPGQDGFDAEQEYAVWAQPTGPDRSTTVWIGELIDALRLQPDNQPCTFEIQELTLLIP